MKKLIFITLLTIAAAPSVLFLSETALAEKRDRFGASRTRLITANVRKLIAIL
ncbi:hypothetical protein [Scytonema hofmannii]|uniref:hypothetical protein n=1 Tax=Scytonema hofmannii TaxID=34078 RepID=UPI00034DA1E5|nr:hypothetical protein [Scytonema hofmannii]